MVFPQQFETKWILFPFSLGLIIFLASKAQWHDSWKQYSYYSVISLHDTVFQVLVPHIPLFASVLPFLAVWGCQLRLQCWEVRERQCWNGDLWLLPFLFRWRNVTPNPFSNICTSFWKSTCRVFSQVESQKGHKIYFMLYWALGHFYLQKCASRIERSLKGCISFFFGLLLLPHISQLFAVICWDAS